MKKALIIAAAAASLMIAGCATPDTAGGSKGNFTSGSSCSHGGKTSCTEFFSVRAQY